jgi:hypothetical protein
MSTSWINPDTLKTKTVVYSNQINESRQVSKIYICHVVYIQEDSHPEQSFPSSFIQIHFPRRRSCAWRHDNIMIDWWCRGRRLGRISRGIDSNCIACFWIRWDKLVDGNQVYTTRDLARKRCIIMISLIVSLGEAAPPPTAEPQHSKRE